MAMPKNSPGADKSRNVPAGRPASARPAIRTAAAAAINPWMHSPCVAMPCTLPRLSATYHTLAPATPATAAASVTTSPAATFRCARPAKTACTATATTTPAATSGTHDPGTRPGPVANPLARVVTRVPELPGGTGFPFGHRYRLRPRRRAGGAGSGTGRAWPGPAAAFAQTIHSPGVTSATFAVTATGPLPGTASMFSTRPSRSPGRGRPPIPVLRPENRTDAG
jgi:hypothetical protein